MTAIELIDQLAQLSPDTRIVVRGYEEGYNDIMMLKSRTIIPHPEQKADYYGEFIDAFTENEKGTGIKTIELYGENTKADK